MAVSGAARRDSGRIGQGIEERHRDQGVLLAVDDLGIEVRRLGEVANVDDLLAVADFDRGFPLRAPGRQPRALPC